MAGGLGKERARRQPPSTCGHAAQHARRRENRRATRDHLSPTNNEETRLLRVSKERKWDPPVSDTLGHYYRVNLLLYYYSTTTVQPRKKGEPPPDHTRETNRKKRELRPRLAIWMTLLLVGLAVASATLRGAPVPSRAPAITTSSSAPMRRRDLAFFTAAAAAAVLPAARAPAADAPKVWQSGRSDPLRPTSKDKPDGTKKDNRYLSCLNDCVPRKQGPPGPSQKERADCLDACQVECCSTYEQCTYTIRK